MGNTYLHPHVHALTECERRCDQKRKRTMQSESQFLHKMKAKNGLLQVPITFKYDGMGLRKFCSQTPTPLTAHPRRQSKIKKNKAFLLRCYLKLRP